MEQKSEEKYMGNKTYQRILNQFSDISQFSFFFTLLVESRKVVRPQKISSTLHPL